VDKRMINSVVAAN